VIRLAVHLYAALLRLYPAAFRERCGAPMLRTFEEWCGSARPRGLVPFARGCAAEYADALAGAWRTRRPQRNPIAARRGDSWIGALAQDTGRALRRLAAQPSLVAFTVLTLGFAIAASASLFSIVDAVLLRPSPFKDGDRLFQVQNQSPRGFTYPGLSPTKLRHWRTESQIFDAIEAYRPLSAIVTGGVEPEDLAAAEVSPGLVAMLGIPPLAGRWFTLADAQAVNGAILISERYWRARAGADDSAIGRTVTVNGKPRVIAGVMPDRFHFPTLNEQIWLPLDPDAPPADGARVANTIVRLRAGLSLDAAQARIATVVARLEADRPLPSEWGISLVPGPLSGPDAHTRRVVLVLFGAVALVLLTACANVANLLLSRAIDRHREFAIRRMLGATIPRVVRELFVEGLLLGLLSGAAGLVVATWAVGTLVRLMPDALLSATSQRVDVDARAIAFGLTVAMLTGILCNLPPALRAIRHQGAAALSGRTRTATATPRQRRLRAALVVVEIGLAVVLLIGAALMARSFLRLNAVDIGFNPDRVFAVTIGIDSERYHSDSSRYALLQRVAKDVADLPGVDGVAVASGVPPSPGSMSLATLATAKGPCGGDSQPIVSNQVTPNYFALMGIAIPDGRPLRGDDPPDAVVVSRSVARRCGTKSLTGARLRLGPDAAWLTVVGTAADVKTRGITETGDLAVYLPLSSSPDALPNVADMIERRIVARRLIVQATRPEALVPDIKRILWTHDPDQPVLKAASVAELMADTIRRERFLLTLLSLFSAVSLALASAGIFGVLAYTVAQRSNEIGIRMALGASSRHVLRLVVGHGLGLAALGIIGGIAAALAFSRVLAGLLYEIDTRDPAVFAVVPALVVAVALLAAWIPTVRALGVDPASALRVD
jgi:putative ABC transport system permease protein